MIINPKETYVLFELERIKWFLGQIDLTVNEQAGLDIQDAYTNVGNAIKCLKKGLTFKTKPSKP